MAVIGFYETNEIDREQLSDLLKPTDHYWEFSTGTLQHEKINAGAEVISVGIHSTVTSQLMDAMPKLQLIAVRSMDFNNIDLDYAKQRNITVVNVPNYGPAVVAEHAFALLLSLARYLPQVTSKVRQGRFRSDQYVGFNLEGKTLGIIGTGKIGRHLAQIARGFQMPVIAYDPNPDNVAAREIGFTYKSFEEVLAESDVVSLHAKLTPNSYHMMNPMTFGNMKPGSIFINTANGELMETRALLEVLLSGHLAGAALDVIEGESLLHSEEMLEAVSENATSPMTYTQIAEMQALLRLDNVIVTPHSGSNTKEAIAKINQVTAENIIGYWFDDVPNKVIPPQASGKLVLLRHGESEWNALGKWTGTTDVSITQKGIDEAKALGQKLAGTRFDFAYISQQRRTKETLEAFLEGANQPSVKYEPTGAINERDYGIYTGMKKRDIQKIIGQNAYDLLRRSWDSPVEGGESLKDVYERTIPFYLRIILPRLRHGQNILVVAHGNSLRALIKYIENVSDSVIGETEMMHDCSLVYEVSPSGRAKSKDLISL